MAENIGYQRALALAKQEMEGRDPALLAANTGTVWTGEDFLIPWLGREIPLAQGSVDQQILWYHYLLAQGPRQPRGRYINYKQVPGAAIYNANFIKRSINPLVRTFAGDLPGFFAAGEALGAEKVSLGNAGLTFHPLPYLPVTCVLWQGDEEMPASGNILFDEGIIDWYCAEDIVAVAGLVVYEAIRVKKQGHPADETASHIVHPQPAKTEEGYP